MEISNTSTQKLTKGQKIFYGIGDAGINLADTMVSLLFAIFLTDVVHLDPGLAAIAIFIGRSSDYLNDPIIGYLSDKTRSRWGRRRPFLLFGSLPFVLAYAVLWWIPPIDSQIGLAIYYGIAFVLYDTAASVIYMPYFALTPELTVDYDERTSLTSYRMAFSILGAMVAFVVPLAIIGTMEPANSGLVFTVGSILGLISIIPVLIVFFTSREKSHSEILVAEKESLRKSLSAVYKNKPFMISLAIFVLTWFALDFVQSTLIYFLKYRMNLEEQSDLIFALLFVAALASIPFWEWSARKLDKQKAYIAGMIFLAVVVIGMSFTPGNEYSLAIMIIFGVFAGCGLGAVQVLTWSMIPDGVEYDELQTGKRHEGMFYSIVTTVRKIAASVTLPLILLTLKITGYDPLLAEQPANAILGIQLLIGVIPAVFLMAGIVFALKNPLNREHHASIVKELASRKSSRQEI